MFQIPTEAGNDIIKDPSLLRNIEEYINNVKAEVAFLGQAMEVGPCSLL
jgi:hypothetical protein